MKKLYSCSATVDENGMVSYRTRIVTLSHDAITMHLVHTSTTMQHTRKYIKYLREHGEYGIANVVEALYRLCIDEHAVDVKFSCIDGTIAVID